MDYLTQIQKKQKLDLNLGKGTQMFSGIEMINHFY